jgi:hypothetical protein
MVPAWGRSGRNQFVIARINATHTQLQRYKRNQRYKRLRMVSGKNLAGARYMAVTGV